MSAAVPRKTMRLTGAAFGKKPATPSLSLAGIAGVESKPGYFSPGPGNLCLPSADLILLRDASALGCLRSLDKAFMGCFCAVAHSVIFRRAASSARSFSWHFGLVHFATSSVAAWPVELKLVPGADPAALLVEFDVTVTEPSLFGIVSWDDLYGRQVSWKSWAWQLQELPGASQNMLPAVRLVGGGPELPMAKLAARCAWWDFDLPLLRKLSAELAIEVERSEGLLQTLFRMTANVLAIDDDEEVMDILGRRLALVSSKDYKAAKLLSDVGEAARCLTHEDEEVVRREQAAGKERDNGLQSFVEEWRGKREQVRQAAAKAAAKAGGRRGRPQQRGSSSSSTPSSLPRSGLEMLSQADLKRYMPPNSYLWKSRRDSAWHARVGVLPSVSRSIQRHGQSLALRLVISEAWRTHCLLKGINLAECPMGDLEAADQEGLLG